MIEQVVLTRFNVRTGFSKGRSLSEAWLEDRFSLFERFCLPSMVSQIPAMPKWVVLFDSKTPDRFKRRVAQLSAQGEFEPVYIGDFESLDLDELVRSRLATDTNIVVTSRIDNDDAYARDYSKRILAAADRNRTCAININEGLVLDTRTGRLFRREHASNPFISIVERTDSLRPLLTAFGKEHNQWKGTLPIQQVEGGPGWMVVVHGQNVSNSVDRARRVAASVATTRFDVHESEFRGDWFVTRAVANSASKVGQIGQALRGKVLRSAQS